LNLNSVVSQLFGFEDFTFTMNVSGAVTAADVGKAVTLDTTAANTVKLAADNDPVYGRLETFEHRTQENIKVGAVARKFRAILPTAAAVTIGQEVSGSATAGAVKPTTAQPATEGARNNRVIEVLTGNRAVVEQL
jgi:hypothetical protein